MGAQDTSLEVTRTVAPVRQQVFKNLRRAIVEGRFRPGDRLVERELCAMTGASRSSVREALRQLEAEGLILTLPDRGPVVRTVTASEAADLYDVRALLEGLAGSRFAVRASDAEVAALRGTVDALEAAFGSNDGRLAARAKDRYYEALLAGARSETAQTLLQALHNRISLLRATTLAQPGRAVDTVRELRAVLDAIERRDAEAARVACLNHVEQAAAVALRVLAGAEANGRPGRAVAARPADLRA